MSDGRWYYDNVMYVIRERANDNGDQTHAAFARVNPDEPRLPLLLAAPEMYLMVVLLRDALAETGRWQDVVEHANGLIAKVQGEA